MQTILIIEGDADFGVALLLYEDVAALAELTHFYNQKNEYYIPSQSCGSFLA